jgi:carbonic anhydrase
MCKTGGAQSPLDLPLVVEPDPSTQMSPDQIKTLHEHTEPSTNRPLQRMGARDVVELVP